MAAISSACRGLVAFLCFRCVAAGDALLLSAKKLGLGFVNMHISGSNRVMKEESQPLERRN